MAEEQQTFPRRFTTPTHLGMPDKVIFGLTARQILLLLLGASLSYSLWLRLGAVIPASAVGWLILRAVCSLPPVLISLLVAFLTFASRPLELWAVVWLRYLLVPKISVWRSLARQSKEEGTHKHRTRTVSTRSAVKTRKKPSSKRQRYASVQRLVPLREIIHDVVCLVPPDLSTEAQKEGERLIYAAVLEVQATNFTLKSASEQMALIDGYRAFLLALRFPLQILVRSQRMDLSSYIARLNAVNPSSTVSSQVQESVEKLPDRVALAHAHSRTIEELRQQRNLLERRFYLILSSEEEVHLPWYAFLPFVGKTVKTRRFQERLEHAQRELEHRAAAITDHLSGLGLATRRLADKDLADLFDRSLRGEEALRHPLSEALFAEATQSWQGRVQTSGKQLMQTPASSDEHGSPEEIFAPVLYRDQNTDEEEDEGAIEDQEVLAPAFVSLVDLLSPSCLMVSPDQVRVADDYLRGIAVVGLPREVMDGSATSLIQLDEVMDITFHLRPQHTPAVLRRLMRQQAQYRSTQRINQRRGGSDDPDLAVAEADTERLIPALASGQERLIDVGFYVVARARSVAELDVRTQHILDTIHNSLLSAHTTTCEHLEAFQATLPTGRDPLGRMLTTTCTALATMLPFISDSLYMPSGIFLGVTGSGEPVMLDPWGSGMDNPHEFWGGISGAGKSFAIKLRIIHELLVHPELQVVVIDPAGEYRKLTEAMGGRSIRIAPGSAQSINPFDLVPAGMDLERYIKAQRGDRLADKIHNLHSFLDILLSDYTPTPTTLKAQEKSLLDKVLYECYRRAGITADPRTHNRPAPLLRDVYEVLSEHVVGEDTTGLASRLERFVRGSMAGLFSRPTNVSLDAPILDFDLREMRGSSEIKPAGVFLISEFLWTQALYHPRPRRCYIDEAWSLIEHQEGGHFLERMAREFRKHYVSLVTITQNPEQFVTDPRGSIIASNAFTKVLKRLDHVGSRAASTAFGLSHAEEQRLTTLEQKKALLMVGSKRMIVEIAASPEEYLLAHTDPDEQGLPSLLSQTPILSDTEQNEAPSSTTHLDGEKAIASSPATATTLQVRESSIPRAPRTRKKRTISASTTHEEGGA